MGIGQVAPAARQLPCTADYRLRRSRLIQLGQQSCKALELNEQLRFLPLGKGQWTNGREFTFELEEVFQQRARGARVRTLLQGTASSRVESPALRREQFTIFKIRIARPAGPGYFQAAVDVAHLGPLEVVAHSPRCQHFPSLPGNTAEINQ